MRSIRSWACSWAKPCALGLVATWWGLAAQAAAPSCSTTQVVGLAVAGASTKAAGHPLHVDYCLQNDRTADMYLAVEVPQSPLLFVTQDSAGNAQFSTQASPWRRSIAAGSTTAQTALDLNRLPAGLPLGTYKLYSVAVPAGGNPLQSSQWLGGTLASAQFQLAANASQMPLAFFYQTVTPTANAVRAGVSADGGVVSAWNADQLNWTVRGNTRPYGDPVISRLSNGRWLMTSWTASTDSRGGARLALHEASCPRVDDTAVRVLSSASTSGCKGGSVTAQGKTSQAFAVDGSDYLFTMAGAQLYLLRLSEGSRGTADLSNVCLLNQAATSLSSLRVGDATPVFSTSAIADLLISDSAIARQSNGSWTLLVKGIARSASCSSGSLCELCARNIYRSTSTDLLHWSNPEAIVQQASVPEAVVLPDGTVRLYYQNFGSTCSAQNLQLAERAPIGFVDVPATGAVGTPGTLRFVGEAFESTTSLHYATNGNPVALPDAAALSAWQACMNP